MTDSDDDTIPLAQPRLNPVPQPMIIRDLPTVSVLDLEPGTIEALNNYMNDDLQRAQRAFRNCTPEEMGEQYGLSGKTRQELLNDYQAHQDRVDAAIAWVKTVGD